MVDVESGESRKTKAAKTLATKWKQTKKRAVAVALPKNLIRPLPRAGTRGVVGFGDLLSRSRRHVGDGMGKTRRQRSALELEAKTGCTLEGDVSSSYSLLVSHT